MADMLGYTFFTLSHVITDLLSIERHAIFLWDHVHDAQITKSARIISANRTELLSSHNAEFQKILARTTTS
jgi:hypothetical protein